MLTTLDSLVTAARSKLYFNKVSRTADAAGVNVSLWTVGTVPEAGATPATGSGAAPTKATVGAMNFTAVGGTTEIRVGKAMIQMATLGVATVYDRLVHTSGLDGTVTTAQTVNTTALTRSVDGEGVEIFVETYTPTGSSAATLTVTYTNQDDVTGRTSTITFYTSPLAGLMQPVPLANGDTGVKSVQSVQLSATTGTAGDFGITLAKRISEMTNDEANNAKIYGPFNIGLPVIDPNACLALMVMTSTTNTGLMSGTFDLLQG